MLLNWPTFDLGTPLEQRSVGLGDSLDSGDPWRSALVRFHWRAVWRSAGRGPNFRGGVAISWDIGARGSHRCRRRAFSRRPRPRSYDFGPSLLMSARVFVERCPNFTEYGPHLVEYGPDWAEIGTVLSELGRSWSLEIAWSRSARSLSSSAAFGRNRPVLAPKSAKFGRFRRFRLSLGRPRPIFCRSRPSSGDIGQVRSNAGYRLGCGR